MYPDEFGRTWEGPYLFNTASIASHAPRQFGVYQVLYREHAALSVAYIGIATGETIHGRLMKHCTGRGNWALGRLGNPARFRFVYFCCDIVMARKIESNTVTLRKPPFNVRPEYGDFIPSTAI